MWMNLHHFLYEKASNRQEKHLKKDNVRFINTRDSFALSELNEKEQTILSECAQFYKDNLIDQQLLYSGRIFKWLQHQSSSQKIADTTYSKGFTETLNRIRPIYEAHFWPIHQEQNKKLLTTFIHLIDSMENKVIQKMEYLSGSQWKEIVRIDLTTYGNWASAYSPDNDNIVISSIDPMMHSTLFIEFLFHESSHLLFLKNGPFRRTLFEKAKVLDIPHSRNLWHAAMFYLSGIATKQELGKAGMSHELIMNKKKVFENYYNNEIFRSVLTRYYHQEIELNEMAVELLKLDHKLNTLK